MGQQALGPRVLAIVRSVADELRPQTRLSPTLGLDHSLERDFGLDSLARVELIARISHDLGVALSEAALTEAETPRDLLRHITVSAATPVGAELGTMRGAKAARPPAPVAPLDLPDSVQTLVDVFDAHLRHQPHRTLVTLYGEGDAHMGLSYADLHRDAVALAAGLQALGLVKGDSVAIMLPTGREFFAAFFGALVAGCVPVPLYPPARPSQLEDHLRRIAGILRNAMARVLVTVERAKPLVHLLRAQAEGLQTVGTVADLSRAEAGYLRPLVLATDVAFLQYTSGSTGEPKGVVLTHANLLANLRAMRRASKVGRDDTFVSWLPLYHDMGLIGACLGALVLGFHLVLMSPLAFLARPARWLEVIHRHRGTVSAAPNFAYELCLSKLTDADLEGLDLSSWRLAFNGAEPVSPDTLERFAERFARCGLKREALTPVYGLAESSVGLAFPPMDRGPLIDRVDRLRLVRDGVAAPAARDDPQPLRIVSCGLPLPGHELRVVDGRGRELPERAQGRVQFRGPSSTHRQCRNLLQSSSITLDAFSATLSGQPLRARGQLPLPPDVARFDLWVMLAALVACLPVFLTGREKDIIIRGGLNIHPQELESAVARLPGVRKGGVAVFPASDLRSGTERLVVLAETRLAEPGPRGQLIQAITALAATLLGAPA
ncbi:MAG TPA: AMP-binding protein, partial [Rubrivivax sp.]|nr:AMP-binding protein [Rubrivivax sp.]